MKIRIKSRKLGKTLTFSRPGSQYIYVDLDGKSPGTLGDQICKGGRLTGSTLYYLGDSEFGFEKVCKSWYRRYIAEESALMGS